MNILLCNPLPATCYPGTPDAPQIAALMKVAFVSPSTPKKLYLILNIFIQFPNYWFIRNLHDS